MLYRDVGQFKDNYAADHAIFRIRQDRLGVTAVLVAAFVAVPCSPTSTGWDRF